METLYSIVGVSETASNDQVKQAYLRLVKNYHPDKLPAGTPEMVRRDAVEKFLTIKRAYDVLSSSERFVYDAQLATQREEEDQRAAFYERQKRPQARDVSPPTPSQPKPVFCTKCGRPLTAVGCAECLRRESSAARKFGAAWRRLDTYTNENHGPVLLWCLFFAGWLPIAIAAPQWGNADGEGWDPSVCWGILAMVFVILLATVRTRLWKGVKWLCKTHPKTGSIAVQVPLLAIIALGVGASNPSRRVSPKPVEAEMGAAPNTTILARFAAGERSEAGARGTPRFDASLTGGFLGTVHNLTTDSKADFGIFAEQNQGVIRGCMTVQKPLFGSGPLHGSVSDNTVRFDVTSPGFNILFEGHRNGNQLSGTYRVFHPGGRTETGEFTLEKTDATELPKGFDPQKNCPTDGDTNR
jgi:hypothetical protein